MELKDLYKELNAIVGISYEVNSHNITEIRSVLNRYKDEMNFQEEEMLERYIDENGLDEKKSILKKLLANYEETGELLEVEEVQEVSSKYSNEVYQNFCEEVHKIEDEMKAANGKDTSAVAPKGMPESILSKIKAGYEKKGFLLFQRELIISGFINHIAKEQKKDLFDGTIVFDASYFVVAGVENYAIPFCEEIINKYEKIDKKSLGVINDINWYMNTVESSIIEFFSKSPFDIFQFEDEVKDDLEHFRKIVKESIGSVRCSIQNLNAKLDGDKKYRKYRKDNRSRWQGGGFGLEGALKGAAEAKVLNAASGVAHSVVNSMGNALDDFSLGPERKQIVSQLDFIPERFVEIVFSNLQKIVEYIKENWPNYIFEENRLKAKKAKGQLFQYKDERMRKELVKNLILYDPHNVDTYMVVATIWQNRELGNQLQEIAELFAIDLCKETLSLFDEYVNMNEMITCAEANILYYGLFCYCQDIVEDKCDEFYKHCINNLENMTIDGKVEAVKKFKFEGEELYGENPFLSKCFLKYDCIVMDWMNKELDTFEISGLSFRMGKFKKYIQLLRGYDELENQKIVEQKIMEKLAEKLLINGSEGCKELDDSLIEFNKFFIDEKDAGEEIKYMIALLSDTISSQVDNDRNLLEFDKWITKWGIKFKIDVEKERKQYLSKSIPIKNFLNGKDMYDVNVIKEAVKLANKIDTQMEIPYALEYLQKQINWLIEDTIKCGENTQLEELEKYISELPQNCVQDKDSWIISIQRKKEFIIERENTKKNIVNTHIDDSSNQVTKKQPDKKEDESIDKNNKSVQNTENKKTSSGFGKIIKGLGLGVQVAGGIFILQNFTSVGAWVAGIIIILIGEGLSNLGKRV